MGLGHVMLDLLEAVRGDDYPACSDEATAQLLREHIGISARSGHRTGGGVGPGHGGDSSRTLDVHNVSDNLQSTYNHSTSTYNMHRAYAAHGWYNAHSTYNAMIDVEQRTFHTSKAARIMQLLGGQCGSEAGGGAVGAGAAAEKDTGATERKREAAAVNDGEGGSFDSAEGLAALLRDCETPVGGVERGGCLGRGASGHSMQAQYAEYMHGPQSLFCAYPHPHPQPLPTPTTTEPPTPTLASSATPNPTLTLTPAPFATLLSAYAHRDPHALTSNWAQLSLSLGMGMDMGESLGKVLSMESICVGGRGTVTGGGVIDPTQLQVRNVTKRDFLLLSSVCVWDFEGGCP
ncbi:hypothetical protein B484DRAFT_449784 [Ochromonadaceae sp. CCMP2298]|nr:hypothetical protein B484DRAFT_449784 [Ochromonadaceae sp. CCMP2298]